MKALLTVLISFYSFALAMDSSESLQQKQLLLHYHNLVNIKGKEVLLPTNDALVNLALIYNKVVLLQENEVKDLSQDTETLYCLVGTKHCHPKAGTTREMIETWRDVYPEFFSKLFDKNGFQQAYVDLPQQVEVVTKKIDQLDNDEIKSLLHAFVRFFSVQEDEKRQEAVALVNGLHKKYPTIISTFEWQEKCFMLDAVIGFRRHTKIFTIDY